MRQFDVNILKKFFDEAKKVAILAIGNPLRGDDSAGIRVGDALGERIGNCEVFIAEQSPENYYFKIVDGGYTHVIIVDAVKAPLEPGKILILDKNDIAIYPATTHDIPLTLFLELLEHNNIKYLIIGIVPKNLEFTEELSKEVKESTEKLTVVLKNLCSKTTKKN